MDNMQHGSPFYGVFRGEMLAVPRQLLGLTSLINSNNMQVLISYGYPK
jgi:hypothetical protein